MPVSSRKPKCHPDRSHHAHGLCDRCYEAAKRAKRGPDYKRDRDLRRIYGITLEDYRKMAERQNWLCRICGKHGDSFCVDHDHITGAVRGLLCQSCNRGIGLLGDSIPTLEKAIQYLRGCDTA